MLLGTIVILFSISCNRQKGIDQAKIEIQKYFTVKYGSLFNIDSIEKDYNPDMFHEQWGFKVWIVDTSGMKIGPVFMQENEVQGWITFKGSDILEEYQKARQKY